VREKGRVLTKAVVIAVGLQDGERELFGVDVGPT
jgi:transposase-like protein